MYFYVDESGHTGLNLFDKCLLVGMITGIKHPSQKGELKTNICTGSSGVSIFLITHPSFHV